MKKLAIFALVLGLAIAIAIPAMAFKIEGAKDQKFYFGGNAVVDLGYWNHSKEFAAGWGGNPNNDRTDLLLDLSQFTMIKASFESGNAGAYWELGLARDNITGHEQIDAQNSADKFNRSNYLENRKIYGWYTFGNCKITVGKLDGSFMAFAPAQTMGYMQGYFGLVGWGLLWDDRTTQVRYSQQISKAFGYQISLVQPVMYEEGTPGPTSIDSYAQLPRVDARFDLNFGPVSLYPGGSWMQIKYDNLPSGWDDNVTFWQLQLPVLVKAGPFVGKFQIGYGQNINGYAGESTYQKYQRVNGSVKNTTGITGFVDLAFTAGIVTPHFYFGYDRATNSDTWKVGDDNNTRMSYGANVSIKISDNFFVVPELTFYDWGKKPNTLVNKDIGTQWIGGAQFMFTF